MRKILCPKCNKVFSVENDGRRKCPSCACLLEIKICDVKQNDVSNVLRQDELVIESGDEFISVCVIQEEIKDDCEKHYVENDDNAQNETQQPKAEEKDIFIPAEVECEGEVIDEKVLYKERKYERKRLKKIKNKSRNISVYFDFFIVSCIVVSAVAVLYSGIGVNTVLGSAARLRGADFIGMFVTGDSVGLIGTGYINVIGALLLFEIVLIILLATVFVRRSGEYGISAKIKLNLFSIPLIAVSSAITVFWSIYINAGGGVSFNAGVFIGNIIIALSGVMMFICLICSKRNRAIAPSPKFMEKKALFTLAAAYFFAALLFVSVTLSVCADIGYAIIYNLNSNAKALSDLALLSSGIFGSLFDLAFVFVGGLKTTASGELNSIYASIALGIGLIVLLIIYSVYIGETKEIFLGKIRYGDSKKFTDGEYEQKQLKKFLSKNGSLAFAVFGAVFTAELVRNILLYSGAQKAGTIIFCMLASLAALALKSFPYALSAREDYMKAYLCYGDLGAEVAPQSNRRMSRLKWLSIFSAIAIYTVFIIAVFCS